MQGCHKPSVCKTAIFAKHNNAKYNKMSYACGWIPFKKQVPRSPPQLHTPSDCPPPLDSYQIQIFSEVKGGYWAHVMVGVLSCRFSICPSRSPPRFCSLLCPGKLTCVDYVNRLPCTLASSFAWLLESITKRSKGRKRWLEILIPILMKFPY